MKTFIRSLLLLVLLWNSQAALSQEPDDKRTGSWMGILNAGSSQLRLVFNINMNAGGQFTATMDSPDQGATGIPMGDVKITDDSLRIEAPMINGFYRGRFTSDSTIRGEWNQNNMRFDLDLNRREEVIVINRPQEPVPLYPYIEEEVSFVNEAQGFSLGDTLSIPEGEGPFPAVILVTGSGSQNRDEELFGHKPFMVMADHLARNGISVLRYDDRGVGSSGGGYWGSTTRDHAEDARYALDFLLQRKEIDGSKIGIIGHSEGGSIAFMLASEYDDIA